MDIINAVSCEVIKDFEARINGSVKIDNHGLELLCPVNEGNCFRISLEEKDFERVFLLFEPTFTDLTADKNYKLTNVIAAAGEVRRVKYWVDRNVDLSESSDWAPVFVSAEIENGALVAIDGNHRLIAHFLRHNSIKGIQAYLFVHQNVSSWQFFPPQAR